MPRPLITLTTDFGLADGYVGVMKGVILGICPEAELVDICHDIRPQAVCQGAYILSCAVPFFGPGAIHLAVVDPGVGAQRRPILVQTGTATYIGPDNGLLSLVLVQDSPHLAIHLTDPRYRRLSVSHTFHGRDIFAPAAAHLAAGVDPRDMGDPVPADSLLTLPIVGPVPQGDGSFLGEVLHVDRFGNLATSFRCPHLPPRCTVEIAGVRIARLSRTFSDEETGTLLAYIGSSDHLEIAVRDGNAAEQLGARLGTPVRVESQT
jgi:S-adenosylmethionine hydrolase